MRYSPQFPTALQDVANALYADLSAREQHPALPGFRVQVDGECLSAPQRVYFDPGILRAAIARSTGDRQTLALCLGSRHCDGHVREACLRSLIHSDTMWVVPFVVQLLGEYVIEIIRCIEENIAVMDRLLYGRFMAQNPAFVATTKRRIASYWDCYHRHRYPNFATYPATLAMRSLECMAKESSGLAFAMRD